jgi:uncharacterized membrane protein YhfC
MDVSFVMSVVNAVAGITDLAHALAYLISGIFEIVIPVLIGLYFVKRFNTSLNVLVIGCVMFVLSLIRVPLNQYISSEIYYMNFGSYTLVLLYAFPSLTAGVFEEGVRYIAYKFLVNDHRIENGLTYGVGHGGAESIILVGINSIAFGYFLLFNPGVFPPFQLASIQASPIYLPFVGLYERIMAIIVQISLSVIVLMTFRTGRKIYFGVAIILHFLIDFLASLTLSYGVIYPELIATGFALGLGFWTYDKYRADQIKE